MSNLELLTLELPGYALMKINGKVITYKHWVKMSNDFLTYEQQRDPRPIVLFGLSSD